MKHLFKFIVLLFSLIPALSQAQDFKRTWNWYFGNNAGVSFASTPPTALTNGAMNTIEGCATISDTNGNLLFYTNGETIWNKNHQIMLNGGGLLGNKSSVQSSIIIPHPANDSLYYLFTVNGGYGLYYHIINIFKQSNLGEVIVKNQLLQTPVVESIVATHHQNGHDIWVLASGYNNNLFFSYLITKRGLVTCPVTNPIGTTHGSGSVLSIEVPMKLSIDGTKMVNGLQNDLKTEFELFDFNKSTGILSNPVKVSINGQDNHPYNLEFSPNKRYLYYSGWYNHLLRFDLSSGIGDSIAVRRDTLYKPATGNWLDGRPRGLQLTPQNQILVAVDDSAYLSLIAFPNSINCNYFMKGLDLAPSKSRNGLPNFISSYFYHPRLDFSYQHICGSNTYQFNGKDTLAFSSWQWRIQKLSGGSPINYNSQNITHTFADTGTYEVRLVAGADTVTKTIHVAPVLLLNLGSDVALCNTDSLVLYAGEGYYCYKWQDSSTASTYTAKQNGIYYVTVVTPDMQCMFSDTIEVQFSSGSITKPNISRFADSLIAPQGYAAYQWYFNNQPLAGGNQHFTIRNTDGSYKVKVTNASGCSIFSDVYNTTDVPEFASSDMNVYPNPAHDVLQITGAMGTSYIIYNLLGQQVLAGSCELEKETISLLSLEKGYYLLVLQDMNGGRKPFKLVKE